jgi:precorrin-2 dehydrogenase/sirohydrochlorin ferrochelatase
MFPIFLKLEGRRVLVVGAGAIAEGKIPGLIEAGASVHIVAPDATPQITYWTAAAVVTRSVAKFATSDLEGAFMVIAATSSHELNSLIYHEAHARGVLCNSVDDPENCDFYYPAVVKRGDLQIAISTNGRSPALAQRLRQELEQQFGPEYEGWVKELGDKRDQLFVEKVEATTRRELLHQLASREAFVNRFKPHGRSN